MTWTCQWDTEQQVLNFGQYRNNGNDANMSTYHSVKSYISVITFYDAKSGHAVAKILNQWKQVESIFFYELYYKFLNGIYQQLVNTRLYPMLT